ncbi:hypothetical protein ABDZ32_11670, partial [Aeromonas veronii]|uniref:hypothetical protein n=1 Tax=Aeromonas veronii TaxID=654 RepID=UPI0031FD2741
FSPQRNDPLAIPRLPSHLSHGRCGNSLNVNSRLKSMTVLVRQSRGQPFIGGLSWFFTRFSGE